MEGLLNITVLIPAAVFFGILLVSIALILMLQARAERRRVVGKIQKSTSPLILSGTKESALLHSGQSQTVVGRFFSGIFSPVGKKIAPKEEHALTSLKKSFLRAGYRGDYLIPVYYGAKIIGAVAMVVVYYFVNTLFLHHTELEYIIAGSILSALVGYSLPTFWLRIRTFYRKEKIFEGLPDALDLMVVCVEAGMGLDAAINRVSEEIILENKVVGEEFKLVNLELRAGKMRAEALRNLAIRCDQEDVSSLTGLLIQTDRFGTSVSQALKVHSDSMRTKRFQRAEELAAKIPVKLVFPLILFIFPALFVVVVGPAAITIYRNLF